MSGHVTRARRVGSSTASSTPPTLMRARSRRSESRSPSRKRMRLSSPTFDGQVGELSQDDIDAFDCLDAKLSQSFADPSHHGRPSQTPNLAHRPHSVEDDGDPFRPDSPCQAAVGTDISQTERIHATFMSAAAFDRTTESPRLANGPSDDAGSLDDAPPEMDYSVWFKSDPSKSFAGFSTAATTLPGFRRPSINDERAKAFFIPSAAAMREAEEKMKKWQADTGLPDQVLTSKDHDSPHFPQAVSPSRAVFSSARNAFSLATETPTPTSLFRSANAEPTPTRSHTSLQSTGGKQTRPFKSPLINKTPSALLHQEIITPLRYSSIANYEATQKPLGFTPIHGRTTNRPKFVTPFKVGMKSGILENLRHSQAPSNSVVINRVYPLPSPLLKPSKRNSVVGIFDLTTPPGRRTLATSGLRPQSYSAKQLEEMGINSNELSQMNLRTAPFYAFTTRSRTSLNTIDTSSSLVFGRSAVLEELHERGCTLAKQAWIDNHWPLVLWKLAGMVALDPMNESDPLKKRWCWPEVIRQLMYRYERDLNGASRPPLRLITTRDASSESPMILCISDIFMPINGSEDHFPRVQANPELEVTDGWYRLRARTDSPLARGVRKGKIRIGRKIAVVGAKLLAGRKEGSEILEAYNSNVLLLTGNSTHMASWHSKLGFQRGPFIATLNSLTADGGNVAVMMLTVIKAYPVAYVEFIEGTDGRKHREGPHDAKEELKLSAQWNTKRESHASNLWFEYEKRKDRLLDYADRLEQRAGSENRCSHDDGPSDTVCDVYDTLQEDPEAAKSIISSIRPEDAGLLARHIRENVVRERDGVSREIEQELESICPPRDVKAFCVIVVNDSRTNKCPSKLTAQVTVWDVPGLSMLEGGTRNPFISGQRYIVTNLTPTHLSAWMDRFSGGEVYLSTRKNSKWTLIND